MLFMCYHAYIHLKETSWKSYAWRSGGCFVLLAEKLVDNSNNTIFPCSMRHFVHCQFMEV